MFENDFYFIEELVSSDSTFTARIALNADHIIFQGHFPGYPVVPGVLLIQIVTDVLSEVVQKELSLLSSSNIKFLNLIEAAKQSAFTISGNIESIDGQFKLKAQITDGEKVFCKLQGKFQ